MDTETILGTNDCSKFLAQKNLVHHIMNMLIWFVIKQNIVRLPGKTTIWLSSKVDTVAVGFEATIKKLPKAKHVVYAYKVGNASKSCDDQEPKGTAGRPMMELLMKRNLDNIALVVVRYFGGVKLGASRLLRTYVGAANEALNKAEFIEL